MPLLHNCIGVEFWENELDGTLRYDEGWEDDDDEESEKWEDEGFDITNIIELEAISENEE